MPDCPPGRRRTRIESRGDPIIMTARQTLVERYANPFEAAIVAARAGRPVVGVTSNTVPRELIAACGAFPLLLKPTKTGPGDLAERFLEKGIFDERTSALFEGIAGNAWPWLSAIVIPRTSEREHKLYLYLREVARLSEAQPAVPLFLYNMLQTPSRAAVAYGLDETRRLKQWLEGSLQTYAGDAELQHAIEEGNRTRAAIAAFLCLRQGTSPRISGVDALECIGPHYFMEASDYTSLLRGVVVELQCTEPRRGPRIVVRGAPVADAALHGAIESHGATVVGEQDWWGSDVLTAPIAADEEPLAALFENYRAGAANPRRFGSDPCPARGQVEGVVFYLPPEDDTFGWDYPRERVALESQGIPCFLTRDSAAETMPDTWHRAFKEFLSAIKTGDTP